MNTEIIKVARKAAAHYKNSDGYAQAAEIITMLCDELEKTQRPVAPPTVKDVLLARWAKDTRELAKLFVDSRYDAIIRAYTTQDGSLCWEYDDALEAEIAYLNSAAEGDTDEG